MKPGVPLKAQKSWEPGTTLSLEGGFAGVRRAQQRALGWEMPSPKGTFHSCLLKCHIRLGLLTCFSLLCTDIPSHPSLRKGLWVTWGGAVCQICP